MMETKVENVTMQILREIEIFSDTEGKYLLHLAEKLRVYEDRHPVNEEAQVFSSEVGF